MCKEKYTQDYWENGQYALLNSLFAAICTRLSDALSRQPQELAACRGANVARYAGALPILVHFLESYSGTEPSIKYNNNPGAQVVCILCICQLATHTNKSLGDVFSQDENAPAQSASDALDSVWDDECPEFSPASYATLTAAELRLTETVAAIHCSRSLNSPTSTPTQMGHPVENWAAVNMGFGDNTISESQEVLFELRARYSRALSRTAYLLRYHNQGRAPICADSLIHLLESVRLAARCADLNPMSHMSTSQPQVQNDSVLPCFHVHIFGTGMWHHLAPGDIGDEDGILLGILTLLSSAKIDETPWVELAAGRTLLSLAPVLLNQWSGTSSQGHLSEEDMTYAKKALGSWPNDLETHQHGELVAWTIEQLFLIATVAIS
jgi:hypothetical protein